MLRPPTIALLLALAAPAALALTATTGQKPVNFPGGDRDNGIFASTLLELPISPRGVALGEAMGAVEGDPSSMWYNAAGLARIKTNSLMVTASQRFADTQLGGGTVTFPTDIGTFAIAGRALNEGTLKQPPTFSVGARCRPSKLIWEGGGALQPASH